MPIYLGTKLLTDLKIGSADITKVYRGSNLVYAEDVQQVTNPITTGTIPTGATFNEAFAHLSTLAESHYVLQFTGGSSNTNLYNEVNNSGVEINEIIKNNFPIPITKYWIKLVSLNVRSQFISSIGSVSDFAVNDSYAGTSFYIIDYSNSRYVEYPRDSNVRVVESNIRFQNAWNENIIFPTSISVNYNSFYANLASGNLFIMVANSGYAPLA